MTNVNVNVTTKCDECGAPTGRELRVWSWAPLLLSEARGSSVHKSDSKAAENP